MASWQPAISSLSHIPSPSASFSASFGHVSSLLETKPSGTALGQTVTGVTAESSPKPSPSAS